MAIEGMDGVGGNIERKNRNGLEAEFVDVAPVVRRPFSSSGAFSRLASDRDVNISVSTNTASPLGMDNVLRMLAGGQLRIRDIRSPIAAASNTPIS